ASRLPRHCADAAGRYRLRRPTSCWSSSANTPPGSSKRYSKAASSCAPWPATACRSAHASASVPPKRTTVCWPRWTGWHRGANFPPRTDGHECGYGRKAGGNVLAPRLSVRALGCTSCRDAMMSHRQRRDWIATRGAALRGELLVPGDKSISHRAVMLAALADGVSRIDGFLEGADTRATAAIFARMGVRIESPSTSCRIVHGVGVDGLRAPSGLLDCGNAGTGMRLLSGLLAAQPFDSLLAGDESLSRRPMNRVIEPLTRMGARIEAEDGGLPPLRIRGGQRLHGIDFQSPVASAQVKSSVLLAGLFAQGETTVREPHPTRDYTERMLS